MRTSRDRHSSRRWFSAAAATLVLTPLLSSCISISWTTEEEARQQQELLRRVMSDEEVLWDPTPVLKNLAAMRESLEATVAIRHSRALARNSLSREDVADIRKLLDGALHFTRTVADTPVVLETFSRSYTDQKEIVPSSASVQLLQSELKRVTIDLLQDNDPKAFAYFDQNGAIPPRIVLSTGLLKDLCRLEEGADQQIAEIRALERDINALPNQDGFKRVRNASRFLNRQMNLSVAALGSQGQSYEYVFAVLFVVAHELAHAVYDRFNPPGHAKQWTELRADLFGIGVAELLTQQAQGAARANEQVLRGGFSTNDPDKLLRLTSDAGFETFLKTYRASKFSDGDATHLPIEERRALLEPVYRELFARTKKQK